MSDVGIVVIGRNEGERLRRCLLSVGREQVPVVYVDSGSDDGSPDAARALGARVVELDLSVPFTAARSRNTGAEILLEEHPDARYVQFVDGDCELRPGWLATARSALESRETWAAVCGRLRERERERSVFTRLADMEWAAPPGPTLHCGGIAMYRVAPWRDVGGFDPTLAAGEEPELCRRLRLAGWELQRLPDEMALHDIGDGGLGTWWRRAVRSGAVYAEGAARHGAENDRYCVRERRSIVAWAVALPVAAVVAAWLNPVASLVALAAYPALAARIAVRSRARAESGSEAALFGVAGVAAKLPQLCGVVLHHARRSTPAR